MKNLLLLSLVYGQAVYVNPLAGRQKPIDLLKRHSPPLFSPAQNFVGRVEHECVELVDAVEVITRLPVLAAGVLSEGGDETLKAVLRDAISGETKLPNVPAADIEKMLLKFKSAGDSISLTDALLKENRVLFAFESRDPISNQTVFQTSPLQSLDVMFLVFPPVLRLQTSGQPANKLDLSDYLVPGGDASTLKTNGHYSLQFSQNCLGTATHYYVRNDLSAMINCPLDHFLKKPNHAAVPRQESSVGGSVYSRSSESAKERIILYPEEEVEVESSIQTMDIPDLSIQPAAKESSATSLSISFLPLALTMIISFW